MARKKHERKYEKNPICNLRLRALIAGCGLRYCEIAEKMYISQSTLSVWFQHEMKPYQQEEVVKAIAQIIWERGYVGDENKNREDFISDFMDTNLGNGVGSAHAQTVSESV